MKSIGAKLVRYLERQPQSFTLGLSLLVTLFIAIIDVLVGFNISIAFFYLIPISIATWFSSKTAGFSIGVICSIAWVVANLLNQDYAPHPIVHIWNGLVMFGFFAVNAYLLSALKASYERERRSAHTDDMTGLANRRFFHELLQIEIDRAYRYAHHLTIAYIDVDDFKHVNDRFGHATGDVLLQSIAAIMTSQVRNIDIVARMGGDEFALLLPETDYESAQIVLQRLHARLLEPSQSQPFSVTFSIGAVTFLALPNSASLAIERADQIMYNVKKSGKNRIEHELYSRSKEG